MSARPTEGDVYEAFRAAGEIARRVRSEVVGRVRDGTSALELATWVEKRIRELGGGVAFPCNIGLDEVAAHSTPYPDSDYVLRKGTLVKVDLGVEIEGHVADTAITVALPGADEGLVVAAQRALEEALRVVRAGVRVRAIGEAISRTIGSMGYRPISNLSGHQIERYNLHAGVSIPNVPAGDEKLEAGKVYAIEPFVTTMSGAGVVRHLDRVEIFRVSDDSVPRARRLGERHEAVVRRILEATRGLPYALRWFPDVDAELHNVLYRRGIVKGYPVLVEAKGEPVAQAEHTVIVWEDGCEVLT
jgi:methionyl aminopeptidase